MVIANRKYNNHSTLLYPSGSTTTRRKIIIIPAICLLLAWFLSIRMNFHQGDQQQEQTLLNALIDTVGTSSSSLLKGTTSGCDNNVAAVSFSLAFEQSFGYFDDIPNDDWKMRQKWARQHRHHLYDRTHPRFIQMGRAQWWAAASVFVDNYEPLFSCPHLLRVGGPGDGPKWMCDPHRIAARSKRREGSNAITSSSSSLSPRTPCLVYSIGSAGLYVWEEGLIDILGNDTTVCEFHIFDPGNYNRPTINPQLNIHYHQWAISSSYSDQSHSEFFPDAQGKQLVNMTFRTFPETLRLLGHENRTIDVLKVDCEFCEWFVYQDWIKYGNVQQLLIETHHKPLPKTVKEVWPWPGTNLTIYDFFDDLQKAGFIMYSKEPNIIPQSRGNMVEWGFIKLHPDFLHGPK